MDRKDSRPTLFTSLWPAALVLISISGSLAAACMVPFVAVAVVAATTLTRTRAVATVGALWLSNQFVGFALLGYPATGDSFARGAAIGVAALAALHGARRLTRDRRTTRLVLCAFGLGFVLFEGILFSVALVVGGVDMFGLEIVSAILLNDAMWFAGLLLLHAVLSRIGSHGAGPEAIVSAR